MNKFEQVFKKSRNVVVAMLHVPALPGCPMNVLSFDRITQQVLKEADIYASHHVDSLMIENMHDIPYIKSPFIGPEIVASMASLATLLRHKFSQLPLGAQILTGGNKEAVAVAKVADLDYIRCEGFTYSHIGDEGWIDSCAGELLRYRKSIQAENVLIFTDIKKKHSSHSITSDISLAQTARMTSFFRSDGLIVTGSETGLPADPAHATEVAESVQLPVLVGSGVHVDNVDQYSERASGYIVGSHFKRGGDWMEEVDEKRVGKFMEKIKLLDGRK